MPARLRCRARRVLRRVSSTDPCGVGEVRRNQSHRRGKPESPAQAPSAHMVEFATKSKMLMLQCENNVSPSSQRSSVACGRARPSHRHAPRRLRDLRTARSRTGSRCRRAGKGRIVDCSPPTQTSNADWREPSPTSPFRHVPTPPPAHAQPYEEVRPLTILARRRAVSLRRFDRPARCPGWAARQHGIPDLRAHRAYEMDRCRSRLRLGTTIRTGARCRDVLQ